MRTKHILLAVVFMLTLVVIAATAVWAMLRGRKPTDVLSESEKARVGFEEAAGSWRGQGDVRGGRARGRHVRAIARIRRKPWSLAWSESSCRRKCPALY